MRWSSIWAERRGRDQDTWVALSLTPLGAELAAWEKRTNKANPAHKPTTVQSITPALIGKPTCRTLKLKAAETKTFFFYLQWKLEQVSSRLAQGPLWLQSTQAMSLLLQTMPKLPWKLSTSQEQEGTPGV